MRRMREDLGLHEIEAKLASLIPSEALEARLALHEGIHREISAQCAALEKTCAALAARLAVVEKALAAAEARLADPLVPIARAAIREVALPPVVEPKEKKR